MEQSPPIPQINLIFFFFFFIWLKMFGGLAEAILLRKLNFLRNVIKAL